MVSLFAFHGAATPCPGDYRDDYRDDFRVDFRPDFRADDLRVDFLVEDLRAVDFRGLLVRAADLRGDDLRVDLRVELLDAVLDVRLRGVFSPFSRASLMPIASACLRLVTLRPPRVLSVPLLRRRIALPTVELAFALYFLPDDFRLDLRPDVLRVEDLDPDRDVFRAAI
jgi:hypothetical protein